MALHEASNTCILLTEKDCQHLFNAGLKVQDGVHPRDLYCYHYLPEWYDGTPLQVLRLIEQVKGTSKIIPTCKESLVLETRLQGSNNEKSMRKEQTAEIKVNKSRSPRPIETTRFSMTMKVTRKERTLSAQNVVIESPLTTNKTRKSSRVVTTRKQGRTTMIDQDENKARMMNESRTILIDQDENKSPISKSLPISTRKRTIETTFSPRSASTTPDTRSPTRKAQRTSILPKYQTPEHDRTIPITPMTEPAAPRPFFSTENVSQPCFEDQDAGGKQGRFDELSGGLVDEVEDQLSSNYCASTLQPVWNVLHRTSSHFQNVWEEVRDLSTSIALLPLSSNDDNDIAPNVFTDHMPRLVPNFNLAHQGDDEPFSSFGHHKSQSSSIGMNDLVVEGEDDNGLETSRTRRQRRQLSATTWRLW